MTNQVCLLLGSNIDPERNLPAAVDALGDYGTIREVSQVWQSAPIGDLDQPDYCNVALLLDTPTTLEQFWSLTGPLRSIEEKLGRLRVSGNKNAPRTIDIDVTLFNREQRSIGTKTVPDPDLNARACVSVPVLELNAVSFLLADPTGLREVARRLRSEQPLQPRPDIERLIGGVLQASHRVQSPPLGGPESPLDRLGRDL